MTLDHRACSWSSTSTKALEMSMLENSHTFLREAASAIGCPCFPEGHPPLQHPDRRGRC